MNSLNDDDKTKIEKLKQKLYSRSVIENASKLNRLHKHNIEVPKSWDENTNAIKDTGLEKVAAQIEKKETVASFLNKKFDNINIQGDVLSKERASKLESDMGRTNAALNLAQAKLSSHARDLYPNLKKTESKEIQIEEIDKNTDFQSDYHPDIQTVKIGESADMQDSKTVNKKKKHGLTFSFFIFMLVFFFFVGAIFYTYINISQGTNIISTNKIDIKITGPVSVKSGEINDFIVDITNNNTTELILSDLIIQYPSGSKSPLDRTQDLNNERIPVGTVKPGETVRVKNSVVIFGEQNVKKNIKYDYEFNINDSATIFKTEKNVGVFIAGSPITVTVNNVKEINNNQELNFDIKIESNTEDILKNLQLKVEYPFGYKLLEASPKPDSDDNTWSFDTIESLSSTTIRLKGKFIGETNVDKNFRFILGIEDVKTKEMLTVLMTQDNLVEIRKPFVATRLLIDGDNDVNKPVDYDQILKSDLIITNNLPNSITDIVVEILLAGVLIDRKSIESSDGFYDSSRDVIFWDKTLNKGLTTMSPGESRELSFNINTVKSSEELIRVLKRSASDITVNIKAQRLDENRVPETVVASTKKQLRLKTDALLTSNMAYDKGPFAPEVNKETVYRYIGSISNTSNTIKDVEFKAKLPPNSTWKGVYSSTISPSAIKYNQSTREITINLGNIESGAGIEKAPKEFYFKIGFTPTLTQSGDIPQTIINPTITATDSFTGDKILLQNSSMTTVVTTGEYAGVDGRVK